MKNRKEIFNIKIARLSLLGICILLMSGAEAQQRPISRPAPQPRMAPVQPRVQPSRSFGTPPRQAPSSNTHMDRPVNRPSDLPRHDRPASTPIRNDAPREVVRSSETATQTPVTAPAPRPRTGLNPVRNHPGTTPVIREDVAPSINPSSLPPRQNLTPAQTQPPRQNVTPAQGSTTPVATPRQNLNPSQSNPTAPVAATPRQNLNPSQNNPTGANRYIPVPSSNNYYYANHQRPVYSPYNPNWGYGYLPRRHSIVNNFPFAYQSVYYGGYNYRYYDGVWYQPWDNYYRVAPAPFGISINILPSGYRQIYVRQRPYYYYNGIYYEDYDRSYRVVSPPVGAIVESLPDGYETIVIDGDTYYKVDDAQYKPVVQENGEIWYQVIKAG